MRFNNPWFLLTLLILPLYIYFAIWFKRKKATTIPFSRSKVLKRALKGKRRSYNFLDVIRFTALFMLIVSLSEPEIDSQREIQATWERSDTDIVICLDVSGSMLTETVNEKVLARRFSNRLNDSKKVIENFVKSLSGQQVAMVSFSNSAKIITPLSDDYSLVVDKSNDITIDPNKQNMTAIGMGISLSCAILKDSPAKSKFIILITDGVNNTGQFQPIEATESFAVPFGVKVYPIGFDASRLYRGSAVDIETLHKIASLTGTGFAGLAGSSEDLLEIVTNIGKSENINEDKEIPTAFVPIHNFLLIGAFLLLIIELYLRKIYYLELQ
ncbi:MAG: hypothetical protein B6226_01910 [Candidatus Cloacimonetes bacterium 4572_65]|nr:MAG: hypothetical protein B6226_01910 [Candidatus Cloacimonetes bacterium 4572_65]